MSTSLSSESLSVALVSGSTASTSSSAQVSSSVDVDSSSSAEASSEMSAMSDDFKMSISTQKRGAKNKTAQPQRKQRRASPGAPSASGATGPDDRKEHQLEPALQSSAGIGASGEGVPLRDARGAHDMVVGGTVAAVGIYDEDVPNGCFSSISRSKRRLAAVVGGALTVLVVASVYLNIGESIRVSIVFLCWSFETLCEKRVDSPHAHFDRWACTIYRVHRHLRTRLQVGRQSRPRHLLRRLPEQMTWAAGQKIRPPFWPTTRVQWSPRSARPLRCAARVIVAVVGGVTSQKHLRRRIIPRMRGRATRVVHTLTRLVCRRTELVRRRIRAM